MRVLRPRSLRSLLCCSVLLAVLLATLLGGAPVAADPGPGDIWNQRHRLDLGLYAGALFPPQAHELYAEVPWQKPFDQVAFDAGLRFGYMPWPFIGLELEGGVMPTQTREAGASALLYHARGHLLGQYPARFAPFILAGYGILGVASGQDAVGDDVDGAFHAGLGLKFHATRRLTVRLDGRVILSGKAGPSSSAVSPHFEALAGVSYGLWWTEVADEKADGDGDGVPDVRDRCPKKAAQTADGCPPADGDGDGVPDDKDRCPDKPARTADGCPPADGDGDGVPDDKDRCPDKPARTADGCPPADKDNDGVPDDADRCPDQPETKNGHRDADGCPDVVPPTFGNVRFALNSAKLRRQDMPVLRKVARALKKHPSLRVKLRGHADESGPEEYNLKLSRRRARAVHNYLLRQGVKASRIQVEALGETEPLSTEQDRNSQAKNRRVEFKVSDD